MRPPTRSGLPRVTSRNSPSGRFRRRVEYGRRPAPHWASPVPTRKPLIRVARPARKGRCSYLPWSTVMVRATSSSPGYGPGPPKGAAAPVERDEGPVGDSRRGLRRGRSEQPSSSGVRPGSAAPCCRAPGDGAGRLFPLQSDCHSQGLRGRSKFWSGRAVTVTAGVLSVSGFPADLRPALWQAEHVGQSERHPDGNPRVSPL